ncbi:T9SS type A sorting domain-containing protein [bacterium]|nr:T9SS type A sorting domain-containing protein [bacterium]MBU1633744.1 T9SS type A sorting domain-containing protein [bacterium]
MKNYNKKLTFFYIFVVIIFTNITAIARLNSDYIYFKNFVYHSNGELCKHTPLTVTFTAYLNNDQSRILIENAPRWKTGGDPNIPGSGVFGVELGNFADPSLEVGDSVFIRFTCNTVGEQGTLSAEVASIPWISFPMALNLSPASLPSSPQNVSLSLDEQHRRIISWSQEADVTYSIYRYTIQDTIITGYSRRLYYRIAENIAADSFIDTSTTEIFQYGYIVYATSSGGIISSHSKEVFEEEAVSDFSITPRATTAILRWSAFTPAIGTLKGYNIYRRKENGVYNMPIAYTGIDTTFIDSRLDLGASYHYKIYARIDEFTEVGETEEITITTLPSQSGFYTYANFKLAVVIYKNTSRGSISNNEVEEIKTMLDVGKLFYWRNSKMKLNIEFTYYEIDEYKNLGDPDDAWGSMLKTVGDLEDLGVMNTQYDIIFRITTAINGFWSFGVRELGLPGPPRETGFSQTWWPPSGCMYQGEHFNNLTWIFVHEVQHAIDHLYYYNGHDEMYHGDEPYKFPVTCGEHYDFQAKMFRTFDAYEDLLDNWGDIYETIDADNDGFPDNEPLVELDEARFGSNSLSADTDEDGYVDKQEAIDGIYEGSDPNNPDTDGDDIVDGLDQYVRFPVHTTIKRHTPTIDGIIEDGWPLTNNTVSYTQIGYSPKLYLCYDNDYLYLALYLKQIGIPEISFDFQSDGWYHSSGNTIMKINPSLGNFLSFKSLDADSAVQAYSISIGGDPAGMWDDNTTYQLHFGRRVISPGMVNLKVNLDFPIIQIEMAIPKREYAGLTLQPGDHFGLNIRYSKVNNDPDQWATTFDQYNFVYFTLDSFGVNIEHEDNNQNVLKHFSLSQNYPNPFNPQTNIRYHVPEAGHLQVVVYNTNGQYVCTLQNAYTQIGSNTVIWNGKNDTGVLVPSGIYFYQLKTDKGISLTKKMVLLR